MLTVRNLTHPTVQRNLFTGMHRAVRLSKRNGQYGVVYLKNVKGNNWLRIDHCRARGFSFYRGNQDLTEIVLTLLKKNSNIALNF